SAMRRNRAKSGGAQRAGPLAETALGTPLSRSAHSRRTVEAGQPVWARKTRVSTGMGVRNWRTAVDSSAGSRGKVGRLEAPTRTSGRMAVNVRKTMLLLLGLGATKNGRASAWEDSSYWAAMELTFR